MQTIPEALLSQMLARWTDLAPLVDKLHQHPTQAAQIERAIANSCLEREIDWIRPIDAWYLASCTAGEPYGARRIWIDTDEAARLTGYDRSHIRRMTYTGKLAGEHRQGLWVRREDVEHLPPRSGAGRPRKETA